VQLFTHIYQLKLIPPTGKDSSFSIRQIYMEFGESIR